MSLSSPVRESCPWRPNQLLESTLPWLKKGVIDTVFRPQDNENEEVNKTRQIKTVRPSEYRVETAAMMAFLPLTSVLQLDKTILLLGKASHDNLPPQILPFPPQAS
jgi:hypothetical protein